MSEETKRKLSIAKKGKHLVNAGGFKKGHIPWSKLHPELMKSNSGSFKKGDNVGEKHPNWKGGRYKHPKGYVMVSQYNHPFKNQSETVYEHRLIMEKYLGRYLTKDELVHHRNGIKDDNRLENLVLTVKNQNWHPCLCPKCGFEFLIK